MVEGPSTSILRLEHLHFRANMAHVRQSRPDAGLGFKVGRLRVGSVRGTTRTEDAQGTPTQSHTSPRKLVYED